MVGALHPALDKIGLYCENSLEHFQWLVEHGVRCAKKYSEDKELPFDEASLYHSGAEQAYPWREIARQAPRGHVPSVMGHTGGRVLMQALAPAATSAGARILNGVSCERLVRESDGRISGMLLTEGEVEKAVRAPRGVVLACGGFIQNGEMLRRYAPELYDCSTPWASAGDFGIGIRMGMGVGAAALRMNQGFVILPVYPPAGTCVARHHRQP